MGDTGAISSDTNNGSSAENALQQLCSPRCVHCTAVHESMCLLCEKAPVTIDTQIKQYGNFVTHGGATSRFDIDF